MDVTIFDIYFSQCQLGEIRKGELTSFIYFTHLSGDMTILSHC